MTISRRWGLGLVAAAGGMSACTSILGGFDFEGKPVGTGGGGGSGGMTSTTASSSSTSTSSSSGTGGGMACSPGTMEGCYSGPAGTEGVGICAGGMQTCDAQGMGYGACAGEVLPKAETCASTDDEDCDGLDCLVEVQGFDGRINGVAASPDGGVVVVGSVITAPAQLGKGMVPAAGPFVTKIGADGSLAWVTQASGSGSSFTAVTVDPGGLVYVAGATSDAVQIGTATLPASQFVVKLDASGNVSWVKAMAGFKPGAGLNYDGFPTSIATSPEGDVVVAGNFKEVSIDLGDGPVLTSPFSATAYVARLSGQDGSGTKATSGTYWTQTFPAYKYGYSWMGPFVGVNNYGDVKVAFNLVSTATIGGSTLMSAGGVDIALVSLSPMGTSNGAFTYGDAQDQWVHSATVTVDGTTLFTGRYLGTLDPVHPTTNLTAVSSDGDGFVMALSAGNNSVRLARGFGTSGRVTGAAMDANGNIMIAGIFSGMMDLGGGILDGAQGSAILLAKFKPDGSLAWNRAYAHTQDLSLDPVLAVAADGTSRLGGYAGVWPLDLGTGPLNTAAKPQVAFLGRFAP